MTSRALSSIRVVELGPYVALPLTGRILASLGAEVIRVETNKALDEMAFIPSWSRGAGQPDYNRQKRRVTLDVRTSEGKELFMELIKISDVFMTNFRRSILARWGIDFPEARRVRPDIIIMWQTALGGNGPYHTYKSYGILAQHMSGVSLMTGNEGDPPAAINSSYSDYHTGVFQPVAIIGALMRRHLTGLPVTMESSVLKSGAVTAGPAILDFQVNGRLPRRMGNRDPFAAPHGVYPCQGEGRYCAIAVHTEAEWQAFSQALGSPAWSRETRFATRLDRYHNQDALDELIAAWTVQYSADAVMERLQAAGVPASVVSQGQDLHSSPHLRARNFYRETDYYVTERGTPSAQWEQAKSISWSSPVRLSETPMEYGHYSNVGEDNPYVFGELLGINQAEIERLTAQEVLY